MGKKKRKLLRVFYECIFKYKYLAAQQKSTDPGLEVRKYRLSPAEPATNHMARCAVEVKFFFNRSAALFADFEFRPGY